MNAIRKISDTDRYARCVWSSKRVHWDIDAGVIRRFDTAEESLARRVFLGGCLHALSKDEKRFVS